MQNRKLHTKSALLLTSIWMAGCAGTGSIVTTPSVDLTGVEMSDLSLTGQTFVLSFDVDNPNPFPLPISSVRYHVQLDDQSFASGETRGDFSVPADGRGAFAISVELDILKSAPRLGSILRSTVQGSVSYELNGSLTVDIPFVKPLAFSNNGVISVAAN